VFGKDFFESGRGAVLVILRFEGHNSAHRSPNHGSPQCVQNRSRTRRRCHTRRRRYPGKNPRRFHDKYKELNPERYASDVQKILASGKTPAGMHRPIMVV